MVLCDYLDVDYQMNKDVYFLNDGEFFVYISEDGKDIVFGLYKLDRSGAPSREKNRLSQDFDFNLGESQTMGNPEIFPSKDMPTPCFN
jgi:CRP-like cAMP-binding protein